ncbi:phage tail sheath family protein [Tissierella praeacuta]|uniref:phage tail sheath family protein n=1 Tax=Tissierella praeacuta TaxID=43131 RepID=UPI003DA3F4CB
MSYKHGIYTYETPTSVVPPILSDAGLPVVIGTAPVNMAKEDPKVNEPVLVFGYAEAVEKFGYSDDWDKFTLCEFMYSHFVLFQRAPIVLINVLDPKEHKIEKTLEVTLIKDKAEIKEVGVLPESLVVTSSDGASTYKLNEDYLVSFNQSGTINITAIRGAIPNNSKIKVSFDVLDTSKVLDTDIIGGVDVNTGKKLGLELINEIFPRFRKVPGLILAPGFSHNPEVAAVMSAKAKSINGLFKAESILDAPANKNYTEIPEWKNLSNIVESEQFTCWPKLKLGNKKFHMSTQLAGVISRTDALNRDVPYVSPSNKNFQCDGTIDGNGDEIFLGIDQTNYLNSQGIVTALNFIGGWKVWGNRTSIYPATSDPKDSFIPVRRMFNWISNTLILTFWSKIDNPQNRRLVETIVDSANLWLNGLTADEFILGGKVAFLQEENPVTDVMDGILKFHVYITPPSPAREIDFIMEYDVNYVNAFIESMAA